MNWFVRHPWLTGFAAAGTLLCAVAFFAWRYAAMPFEGAKTRIYIPREATAPQVRDSLSKHLGPEYAERVMSFLDDERPAVAGSYVVEAGMRVLSLARRLRQGRQTPVRFTFNNLRHFSDLAGLASRRLDIDSAAFMAAADSLFGAEGYKTEEYAALVIPDTHEVYWTAAPGELLKTLYKADLAWWTPERLAKARSLGLTPVQAATLASVAEEETNDAAERGVVARVYMNRLKQGMRLQADPTVKFAAGNFEAKRVGGEMLLTDSPYNTYRVSGLPPGPIRIPEAATLQAVLDAPENDYLYFCASPAFDGTHVFARTWAEHRANADAYRRALDARGIH